MTTTFAKWVYRIAGTWGFLALVPMFFTLQKLGEQSPPAVTHPEFYYGFVCVALTWQILFFLIASDPIRYRQLMPVSILEKAAFAVPFLILVRHYPMTSGEWVGAMADCLLGVLFLIAYLRTPQR